MMEEIITVNYQTRKDYCNCCEQKLPNAKISEMKEFDFDKKSLMSWGDWNELAQYDDDLNDCVEQYVCETIGFFAESSTERILVNESELVKVKEFILKELTS